ncbi:MAG: RDD family protein [Ktedonobacteraceae bacterium]
MDEEKCAQCGTPASPGAKFCESCGAPLTADSQSVEGPAIAEPARSYVSSAETHYQGVAIRFVAFLIDAIVFGIISSIVTFPFRESWSVNTSTGAVTIEPAFYAAVVLAIVIELLYFTLLLGRYGQSVGMMIVRIKVVTEADSSPITYGAALVRTILLIVDAIPYVIPYLLGAILIWTSDKKQRLGDRVAQTIVVKA